MTTTTNTRKDLYAFAMQGKEHSPAISEKASEKIDAYRAAVLQEAADRYQGFIDNADTGADPRYWSGIHDMTLGLRRMAAEKPEAQA